MQSPSCIADSMWCISSIDPLVRACQVMRSPHNLMIADLPLCCLSCKSSHLEHWISDFVVVKIDNLAWFRIERDKQMTEWKLREHTKWNALLDGKSCSGSLVEKPWILHFELGAETRHLLNRCGEESSLNFLVILSTHVAMVSYLAGWWWLLWDQWLLVDWLAPTLIIPASGFLQKVEHCMHIMYSLYNVGCFTGINKSKNHSNQI